MHGNPDGNETEMVAMGGSGDLVDIGDMEEWAQTYDRDFESREPLTDEMAERAPAYKDDVGFVSGVRRTRHITCFVLTVALYTLVALYCAGISSWMTDKPHEFLAVMSAMYVVYCMESFESGTSVMLRGIRTAPQATEYFHKMMDATPYVKWSIRSFHLKRPMELSAAQPSDKVFTHCRTGSYELRGCMDDTPLRFFTSHRMCLYNFAKSRRWRDPPAIERHNDEKDFFASENRQNDHCDVEEIWGLEDYDDTPFLASRPGQEPPPWATWRVFMIFTLLGLSFFYRIYFASKIGKRTITFKKIMW
jgi:hypothetical protein